MKGRVRCGCSSARIPYSVDGNEVQEKAKQSAESFYVTIDNQSQKTDTSALLLLKVVKFHLPNNCYIHLHTRPFRSVSQDT